MVCGFCRACLSQPGPVPLRKSFLALPLSALGFSCVHIVQGYVGTAAMLISICCFGSNLTDAVM